jgi:transglycosylase-like protein
MSPRTEHPPSTDDGQTRAKTLRRAVIGGAAGVALLVGPVLLANVVVPDDNGGSDKVEAAAADTSLVALRQDATVADAARAGALQSLRTTTTLPPTTTTAPPPPTTEEPTTTTTEEPSTTTPPADAPVGEDSGGGFGDPSSYATWDALAECESGGNWAANTGNGYYGGLQFSASTWHAVGGEGLPSDHSRETQIHFGQVLQARSGWGQWPACTRELGLR